VLASSRVYSEWWKFGAPEEIRTPAPQIRSLGSTIEIIEVRYRKNCLALESLRRSSAATLRKNGLKQKRAQQKILRSVLLPMQDNEWLLETEPTKKATVVKVAMRGWRHRAIWRQDPCSQSGEGWLGVLVGSQ
jgi:hypothetical protein